MKDNVLFLNMFALYEPPERALKLLERAVITGAELDPAQRIIDVELETPGPIPFRDLRKSAVGWRLPMA